EEFFRNKSVVKAQRSFRNHFKCRKAPTKTAIHKLVKKFRKTGTVRNSRKGKSGRKKSQSTPENVERVRAAINHSPKKSVRRLKSQLQMSYGTVQRILRKFLKMYPYKIQIQQPLKAIDMRRRLEFSRQFSAALKEEPEL